MAPEYVFTPPALIFFWEDFSRDIARGFLPLAWKELLTVRSRLEMKASQLNDEQRLRLERADRIVRSELAALLEKKGHTNEYRELGTTHDRHDWWFYLGEQQ